MKSIEEAITEKFPDVIIHEVRKNAKFGIRILGTIPAQNEYDKDHIVEWTGDGIASECYIDSRDYREIGWNGGGAKTGIHQGQASHPQR